MDDVFDEAELLETVQGDRALLDELGKLFIADAPSHVDAIRDAIARSDASGLRFAAHALKGSAATLTARRVAQQARELENLGATGSFAGAHERLQALELAITELHQRLG